MQVQPEVRLMPQLSNPLPRCECHFGWDQQTTHAFKAHAFDTLKLSGGREQNFILPDLGNDAGKVTALWLDTSAVVEGLEQFSEHVQHLNVSSVPKNSIDLSLFKKLDFLAVQWDRKIADQVNQISRINGLSVSAYTPAGITQLNCARRLKKFSVLQGNLETLEGINSDLEELSIVRARNYSDIDAINSLTRLQWLECEHVKKAHGTIQPGGMPELRFLRLIEAGCVLDLQGIENLHHLEKIWSNGEHINLNWEALLRLPRLKMVGLFDSEVTDQQIRSVAENSGKKMTRLYRAGTKKKPHIQITFENYGA